MKHIPLRNSDLKVKVDNADYEALSKYNWTLKHQHNSCYALRNDHGKTIYMHRQILGLVKGDGLFADHINGNSLDNRRNNLRIATISQNSTYCKRRKEKKRLDGYFGIKKIKDRQYVVRKFAKHPTPTIKYSTARKAAKAYDELAIRINKEFAILNFPKKSKKLYLSGQAS